MSDRPASRGGSRKPIVRQPIKLLTQCLQFYLRECVPFSLMERAIPGHLFSDLRHLHMRYYYRDSTFVAEWYVREISYRVRDGLRYRSLYYIWRAERLLSAFFARDFICLQERLYVVEKELDAAWRVLDPAHVYGPPERH